MNFRHRVGLNGRVIEYPAGYRSFNDYVAVLRSNLDRFRHDPKYSYLVPQYEASLAAALAIDD